MTNDSNNIFEKYLQKFSEAEWQQALDSLLPSIHEVDRSAVQIWFRFYPLSLDQYLAGSTDIAEAKRSLAMLGDFGLETRIDTSHYFLYGHRHWKVVKAVIEARAKVFADENADLAAEIESIAASAASQAAVDPPLLLAIAAAGLMTLRQVGLEKFTAAPGETVKPQGVLAKSVDAIVAERRKDDSQGIFGFLKTVDKKFSVIHDELHDQRFEILNDQEIASASANDKSQDWQSKDPRCWEGPVPVECTSASCGTCWVGVLAGREKLSEIARRERRALKVFGYNQSEDPKPIIRLACQAKAYGNVTIVIPPWNAVFGKKVYGNVEELGLEPVTSSAKALREAVREAVGGESAD
jgi:ferredoxin